MLAGVAGSLGALGVILALTAGGNPIYIMPLVFGGAPVVNTLMSAYLNKSFYQLKAPFLAGLILVITGAVTVLIFKPQVHATPNPPSVAAAVEAGAGDSGGVEKKAEHFISLASSSLSIFPNSKEKRVLENLTTFSLERSF